MLSGAAVNNVQVFAAPTVKEQEMVATQTSKKLENYKNNIGELTYFGDGEWNVTDEGLLSDAIGKGDCFAFSKTHGTNFVYSTDVCFKENQGAAALLFRSNAKADDKESYAVNIDASNHKCKFFRWQRNDALQLIDEKEVKANEDGRYTLKVVAIDSWILYYVNDELVASSGDYTLQPGDLGQDTVIPEGVFGLLNWNSKVVFQNTYYKELNDSFSPLLDDIKVTSDKGTVEKEARFVPTEPMMLQYVKNDASEVNIEVEKRDKNAAVEISDADGKIYEDGEGIPVKEGKNYITVKTTVSDKDGNEASAVYKVNVHRFKQDVEYYNEVYRDQYHYSVKEGWANDPNGLVYYNGKYHLFYQFYDDIKWGPMHWAHATSKDLLHWEEEPIAFYPDANGAMFSGCIVADSNNSSGLFKSDKGGLVALITADGNGQRIKVAYSEDEGKTWNKLDKVAADWTNDPLNNRDFRDPKVFRWEGKWFMVVAGGPLRIYSSENLLKWKCESAYGDLHTECPDLYPIKANDGKLKWVLSRGGRLYKVGSFKETNGKWAFIPDEEYKNKDGIMNFGRDSYAAMTYYVQDFGTEENPEIPEITEINWMNTWEDYCNSVAEKTGQDFNGTFNLNLNLGLKKDGSSYLLTQTPIMAYEKLRKTSEAIKIKDAKVTADNNVLKDFSGDTYEICAKFLPDKNTKKVGFKLRKGAGEETVVAYDVDSKKLYIDRSESGIAISNKFKEVSSQDMKVNADGSIELHIYVDKASVEVFSGDNTVCGAAQIFANPLSLGAEAFAEGGSAKADIDIYPMESIWTDKKVADKAYAVGSTSSATTYLNCGESTKLNAYVLPLDSDQDIEWSLESGEGVIELSGDGEIKALQKGNAVVVAAAKADPSLIRKFAINVYRNTFKTNVKEFVNLNGNWTVDDDTLFVSNSGQNDYYMAKEMVHGDYVWDTDIKFTKGLINLFILSEQQNPIDGDGAYSIQFAPDNKAVRLFRFGRDDMFRGELKETIGDGKYHHVKVKKAGQSLSVYVDDESCLEYTFADDVKFSDGFVGLGLWDGALEVQNFYVNAGENEDPGTEDPTPENPTPENPTPENPTPENPTPENPTPENPTPENPTPVNPTPENPTPENPTPENPTPENPTPENPTPENPTPENPTPEQPEVVVPKEEKVHAKTVSQVSVDVDDNYKAVINYNRNLSYTGKKLSDKDADATLYVYDAKAANTAEPIASAKVQGKFDASQAAKGTAAGSAVFTITSVKGKSADKKLINSVSKAVKGTKLDVSVAPLQLSAEGVSADLKGVSKKNVKLSKDGVQYHLTVKVNSKKPEKSKVTLYYLQDNKVKSSTLKNGKNGFRMTYENGKFVFTGVVEGTM